MCASDTQMPSDRSALPHLELPVLRVASEITSRVKARSSLVLVAQTGSGKTTQVPRILLESGAGGDGRIVVLQPRRLAARAVARRVAAEMGVELGGLVGFRTRYERAVSDKTRILFMTDGLFVRLAQGQFGLDGISTLVLDEFHERGLSTDLAAGIAMRAQQSSRSDLRLVVMSATLDSARVAAAMGCETMDVEGRTFPVECQFTQDPAVGVDVPMRAAELTAQAIRNTPQGDALVFMPGRREIAQTIAALSSMNLGSEIEILPLHGSQQPEEQDRAIIPGKKRKIIVATNIAQTSLTIPSVRIVVDSGLERVHRFDPPRDLNALRIEPISQASAQQRAGRAGRVAPGICIRLWSAASHARRNPFDSPEVHRIDLSEALLGLAAMGIQDPMSFPWIDAPQESSIHRAGKVLRSCGAFDANDRITSDGMAMSRIPAHPRTARALIESARRGCLKRAALWAAMLSERDAFDQSNDGMLRRHLECHDIPSDMIARERALEAWRRGQLGRGEFDVDAAREITRAADELEVAASAACGVKCQKNPGFHEIRQETDQALAHSFVLGFPDRVAWRFDRNRPHAAIGQRRRVSLERRSLHQGAGPLLAFEIRHSGTGDSTQTTLSMTAGLEREWLERALPERFATRIRERWCDEKLAVDEVEERLFDDTVIEETIRPPRDVAAASCVIADRMAQGELVSDDFAVGTDAWLRRTRWVAEHFPDRKLLAYDEEDRRLIFREITAGATRWSQVCGRPTLAAFMDALSWDDRSFVERMAPAEIKLPSGYRMKLDYQPGSPPRGSAKIQDFYDLKEHPRVADGRVPVLVELLGPNRRPLQTTSDITGFWGGLYLEIRPELKRRYPRHLWR